MSSDFRPMSATSFAGFSREVGPPGVRNYVLVLSATGLTGPCARRIAAQVHGTVVVCNPVDTGLLGDDRDANERVLRGFIRHPNVGAVVIIAANVPKLRALEKIAKEAKRPVVALALDDFEHDVLALSDAGVRAAATLVRATSTQRRTPQAVSELFIGLECGRSDPSSGLVANPVIGRFADYLIEAGGRAAIGETTEWLGAEHLLSERGQDATVAAAIIAATHRREQMAKDAGVDLLGNNPGPTNIAAGLSTIEEKSLGNIAKSGSKPIRSVLAYAEAPATPGMHLMDAPAYAPESLTGFTAAGAQLHLFSTGVGNSFVSALAPTIKLTGNPHTAARLKQQIDFSAACVLTGEIELDEAALALWTLTLGIMEGTLTWGEILGEGEEVISRFGASL